MVLKGADVLIKPGTEFTLPIYINQKGASIRWTFSTDTYDMEYRFGKFEKDRLTSILVESEKYIGNGTYAYSMNLEEPGTYAIVWDNTASWIREKRVTYTIEISLPQSVNENCAKLQE